MPIITPDTVDVQNITVKDTPCGPTQRLRFSDTGSLTQFGAFVETLPPGSRLGADVVTYPDHDRILTYDDAAGTESFTTLDGTPGVGSAYRLPGA